MPWWVTAGQGKTGSADGDGMGCWDGPELLGRVVSLTLLAGWASRGLQDMLGAVVYQTLLFVFTHDDNIKLYFKNYQTFRPQGAFVSG